MSVVARLAGFAAVLGLVLLGGLGLGRAVGPVDDGPAPAHGGMASPSTGPHDEPAGSHAPTASAITGLAVAEDGYALRLETTALTVGEQQLSFRITGRDGADVPVYDVTHERELHLVVVRRDGTGFQHLHPERTADGAWTTPLALDRPGAYRAYADFAPAGEPARTLATDLLVPGPFDPAPWPAAAPTATVNGLTVALSGHLAAGEESTLSFDVTRDGRPVALERYLGAAGHLVVLREGDLGYLHVHADGDELVFATTAPTPGRYRAYLQLQVDDVVHTVEMTLEAEEPHA
jgi:hypothetical protein